MAEPSKTTDGEAMLVVSFIFSLGIALTTDAIKHNLELAWGIFFITLILSFMGLATWVEHDKRKIKENK